MKEQKLVATRDVYGKTLVELGKKDPNIVVLDADLAVSTKTSMFGKEFPDRFFDMGIAEQDMISTAAGLAACGKIPFANTFSFLAALRAGDPVRSLLACNELNVKIAGAYAGLSDARDGASHQSVCDLAVMRSLPNMIVMAPKDENEMRRMMLTALEYNGPIALRYPRGAGTGTILEKHIRPLTIGKGETLKEGEDVLVFLYDLLF